MTVNTPLLRKTLEHITEHPEEWDQRFWAARSTCGTRYCLAGWAVQLAGEEIAWDGRVAPDGIARTGVLTDGRSIEEAAADALGIPAASALQLDVQGVDLFATTNTLRDLYGMADRLTDGEIPIPDVLPDGS